MENWLRLPKAVQSNQGGSSGSCAPQAPFPPRKKQKVKAAPVPAPPSAAQPLEGERGRWNLAAKSFVSLDTRLRLLEGNVHESISVRKEETVIIAMKAAGTDYNAEAQGKSMPSPHLFVWPALCRAMYDYFADNVPLRAALDAHHKEFPTTAQLGRVVRHCTVYIAKRAPTAIITVTVRPQLEQLWNLMRDALLTLPEAKELFGAPSRGPMYRIFQSIIK